MNKMEDKRRDLVNEIRRGGDDRSEGSEQKQFPGGRSKEEILEQRKAMMRSKVKKSHKHEPKPLDPHEQKKMEFQHRLSKGEKTEVNFDSNLQVTKKDMLKLTSKNYELLPEVKKKKEEELKKEEFKMRMKNVKELEQKRKEMLRKKY